MSKDIDALAKLRLNEEQLKVYHEKTRQAREKWQQAQSVYTHLTRRPLPAKHGQTWGTPERQAATRFLEYQQALWSVLMSCRTGQAVAKQDERT